MKRTGFKPKPRKPLAAHSANPANVRLRGKKKQSKRAQNAKLPAWIRAIPESQAHGSGTLQKRLWRLTSDYVRIRDFNDWGYTVDGKRIDHWRDTQAGHFREYSICNGMFKFFLGNINAESPQSNSFKDSDVRDTIEAELERRYGKGHKQRIIEANRLSSLDFGNGEIIEQMKFILKLMADYPQKPDYYQTNDD